ncbi:oxidoreductase [Candidatus Poribacteria bacterium]|nr:oxidoreductase [Candidatus Poribacteria bacterium]
MAKVRAATVWMAGCAGCHMSFLDLDEWLFEFAKHVDVVYTPIADVKEYPEDVDVALVEGAVATDEQVHLIRDVRRKTKALIAFGDCAVTSNVPAMRNPFGGAEVVLKRSYEDPANLNPQTPREEGILPVLLDRVRPIHEVVPVDIFLPGCPPPAARIQAALEQLLSGEPIKLEGRDLIKFG